MPRKAKDQPSTTVELVARFRVTVNDVDDPDDTASSTIEDNVVEGMTSADMDEAIAKCLAGWYLSLMDDGVSVAGLDCIAIHPPKDKRRKPQVELTKFGVRQTV